MNTREIELKNISNEFSIWEVRLQNLSSMSLYDSHNLSEESICDLFNTIFDYELMNLNTLNVNFPAIDLGDKNNSICIQVTATKSSKKIQKTLDKFIEHKLHNEYSELFIVILGKKQKSYNALKINENLSFDYKSQILDFRDILNIIRSKPVKKLKEISNILKQENNTAINGEIIKVDHRKLKRNLKRKLQDNFYRKLDYDTSRYAVYEPWVKFVYRQVLIRSVKDYTWPEVDWKSGEISPWFKLEFWDFYENGIEFVWMSEKVLFHEDGKWETINSLHSEYYNQSKTKSFSVFYRIPFEYIVDFDMNPDPCDGLPSIFVTFAKNGMPYEDILYGEIGSFEKKKKRKLLDQKLQVN